MERGQSAIQGILKGKDKQSISKIGIFEQWKDRAQSDPEYLENKKIKLQLNLKDHCVKTGKKQCLKWI